MSFEIVTLIVEDIKSFCNDDDIAWKLKYVNDEMPIDAYVKKRQSNGILTKVPSINWVSKRIYTVALDKQREEPEDMTQIMCHVANAKTTIKTNMYTRGLRYHHGTDIIFIENRSSHRNNSGLHSHTTMNA